MSVSKLLQYGGLDKNQTIESLLASIDQLEQDVSILRELVNVNGEIALETIRTNQESFNKEVETLKAAHAEHLEQINEICAEAIIMVRCVKCGGDYELPCDVSEFNPEYSYCGKGGPSPCTP